MKIENAIALVTGANRGIGRSLVTALLAGGAKRIYAGARDPKTLHDLVAGSEGRVVALKLDITSAADVEAASRIASDVNLVINNAGSLSAFGLLSTSSEVVAQEFATNFYGPLYVVRALLPALEKNGGAIANVLTVVALASMPGLGGYSASKAAAWSMTQALRGELKPRGIAVHAIFPGPVDTEMAKAITLPKTSPDDVARAIVLGIARGDADILPDPMAQQVFAQWARDPKSIETQFGAM